MGFHKSDMCPVEYTESQVQKQIIEGRNSVPNRRKRKIIHLLMAYLFPYVKICLPISSDAIVCRYNHYQPIKASTKLQINQKEKLGGGNIL